MTSDSSSASKRLISIILPCRNEEVALPFCLQRICETIQRHNLDAEVIVSDSSNDRSPEIARDFGATLVKHDLEGYGNAYLEGCKAARGTYLFLADADGTYDFSEIPRFIGLLNEGHDLVIGNRFAGVIESGAMPRFNRYLGNPVLSGFFRLFFGTNFSDTQCGMRALTAEAYGRLGLRTTGMEFASEMVIKAVRQRLRIAEVPINYYRRRGRSKLRPVPDGWRNLRFMLLYSPQFLFLLPGILMFGAGILMFGAVYSNVFHPLGFTFQHHPMFFAALLVISGYQLIFFSLFAKTYAVTHLGEPSRWLAMIHRYITIERASIAGIVLVLVSASVFTEIFWRWVVSNFGELNEVRALTVALTILVVGMQTIFSSFMLSILGIKEK